jgi:hypothetical protein
MKVGNEKKSFAELLVILISSPKRTLTSADALIKSIPKLLESMVIS